MQVRTAVEHRKEIETHLEVERLFLVEFDQQDRLLVVRRHQFALLKSAPPSRDVMSVSSWQESVWTPARYSQSTRVETLHQIGDAFPLDGHLGRDDVVADPECDRNDLEAAAVQDPGEGRAELSHVDNDLLARGNADRSVRSTREVCSRGTCLWRLGQRLLAADAGVDSPQKVRLLVARSIFGFMRDGHGLKGFESISQ